MLKAVLAFRCKTCANLKEIVICRNLASVLSKESFEDRALKCFKETTNLQKPLLQRITLTEGFSENIIKNQQNQLDSIEKDLERVLSIEDFHINNKILADLESRCISLMPNINPHDIFYLLYKFYKAYPHQTHTTYFYMKAISHLVRAAEQGLLSDQEIIQLLFYMSFNKESTQYHMNAIRPHLPDIKKLSLFDKCVIAHCFYKCEIQFTSFESKEIERTLEEQFESLKKDTSLLITLCKALTTISMKETLTLKKLTEIIITSKDPWSFSLLVNLLSLYSKALLFEPKVIDLLVKDCVEALKKDLSSEKHELQLIDINKFLRSVSNLGLTLTTNEKLILRETIEQRFEEYKQKKNLSFFINAILSLHILRCWSTKLLIKSFEARVFEPVYQHDFFWRVQARLQLLITQINLEMKMSTPKSLNKPVRVGFTASYNVNMVKESCLGLITRGLVNSAEIECPIQALTIPGVTLKTNNEVYHVDVLDNSTCLKDTNVPHGLMNLKLRLLSRLRMRQILVSQDLIKEPYNLQNFIIERIKYGRSVAYRMKF